MVMWPVVAALSLDWVYAGTFEAIVYLRSVFESIETFLWIQLRADKTVQPYLLHSTTRALIGLLDHRADHKARIFCRPTFGLM